MTTPATTSRSGPPAEPELPSIALADLVGAQVLAPGGRRVGKVIDVEVRPLERFRVAALIVGRFAFLGRFALVRGTTSELENVTRPRIIPWSEVERFDGSRVVLREPRAGARDEDA